MADAFRTRFFDRFQADIVARIPLNARHVLAVGRDAGRLGAAFLRRAPLALWSVVHPAPGPSPGDCPGALWRESDPDQLQEPLTAGMLSGRPAPDVLVLGALEDFRHPARTTAHLAGLLSAGAAVVAWIDNPAHLTALGAMVAGEGGAPVPPATLPRRFLTLDDALGLLRGAGLLPSKISSRTDDGPDEIRLSAIRSIGEALGTLGHDPGVVAERLRTLGHLIIAVKPPAEPALVLQHAVMAPDLMAARVHLPMAALNSLPAVQAVPVRDLSGLPNPAPGAARILVLQRQLVIGRAKWLEAMASIVAQGWLLVAEWDDHPELLPGSVRERWLLNPWLPFSGVHAVQVSTPRLAMALREHNPEVKILPNALLELPPFVPRAGPDLTIVCAAMSRPGLAGIVGPALDAAAAADERVRIEVVADADLFGALRTERKRFHPVLAYPDYLGLLERADISVMPIQGLPAERFKSALKFMEGAGRGAVCIGSPILYEGVIRHGRNGLLAQSPEEWTEHLLALVRQPDLRARLAEGGWRSVRESHMLSGAVGDRVAWYRDLWQRRRELRAALAHRHPEFPAFAEP